MMSDDIAPSLSYDVQADGSSSLAKNAILREVEHLEAVDEPASEFIVAEGARERQEQGPLVPQKAGDIDGFRSGYVLRRTRGVATLGAVVRLLVNLAIRVALLELGEVHLLVLVVFFKLGEELIDLLLNLVLVELSEKVVELVARVVFLELAEKRVDAEDCIADLREARARSGVRPEDALQQIGGVARNAEFELEIVLLLDELAEVGVTLRRLLPRMATARDEVDQDEPQCPYICVLGPVRAILANTFCYAER